jgi:hypothetical protein
MYTCVRQFFDSTKQPEEAQSKQRACVFSLFWYPQKFMEFVAHFHSGACQFEPKSYQGRLRYAHEGATCNRGIIPQISVVVSCSRQPH